MQEQGLQEKIEHETAVIAEPTHAAPSQSPLSEADWVAVAFAIFAVIFWRKAWPKIMAMLDERSNRISQELQKAAILKDDAKFLLAETRERAEQSEKAAAEMIATAKAEAKRIIAKTEADLKEDADRKIALLEQKIKRAEQQAIENVKKQAVEEATKIAEKLLAQQANGKNAQKKLTDISLEKILDRVS